MPTEDAGRKPGCGSSGAEGQVHAMWSSMERQLHSGRHKSSRPQDVTQQHEDRVTVASRQMFYKPAQS
eukprot:2799397-Pyramimonas_sp.AAC.1